MISCGNYSKQGFGWYNSDMKQISILVAVVIAVAAAGYFFMYNGEAPVTNTPIGTSSQEKLNINAVCEGALVYMTFSNGAEAEKFVAECKEGKHPEVIDRYKAEMNLGDGAVI